MHGGGSGGGRGGGDGGGAGCHDGEGGTCGGVGGDGVHDVPASRELYVRPRALRAMAWRNTCDGQRTWRRPWEELRILRAMGTYREHGAVRRRCNMRWHRMCTCLSCDGRKVRWEGRWWWREVSAPAQPAPSVEDLDQDTPMRVGVDEVDSSTEGQTSVQGACTHAELAQACTFDAGSDGASGVQGAVRAAGGASFCTGGACAARAEANSPGAVRGEADTQSGHLGIGASQRTSRSDETIKTGLGGKQGDVHGRQTSVYGGVLHRAVRQMGGALSRTRVVADATVARARRLFFRDAG